jgi:hypothetical protein
MEDAVCEMGVQHLYDAHERAIDEVPRRRADPAERVVPWFE